jgi:hypothetical protein
VEDTKVRNIKKNVFSERGDVMYHSLGHPILFKDLLKLPHCHVALGGQHASLDSSGHSVKLGSGEADHCRAERHVFGVNCRFCVDAFMSRF